MLEIIIAIILGVLTGIITGLIPGIHINLVATLLFVNSSLLLGFFSSFSLAAFIISVAIVHTFLDFIPSIFLGAPNEETALSILPGHRLLLKGRGYEAVKLTTIGCFFGLVISMILSVFFIFTAPLFYPFLSKIIAFLLIVLSAFLIIKEKRKFLALLLFVFSGIIGFAVLNFPVLKQPLFPLFTGLFGTSLLTISLIQKVKIPKQVIKKTRIDKKDILNALGLSTISSSLVSFLPGLGSAQAAVISSSFRKISEKAFLILLGAISSITLVLSFIALYSIDKPRSGVAVFVGKFLPNMNANQLIYLLIIALIVGVLSFFISLFFAKKFTKIIEKVNYKWLCIFVLSFLVILTPIISGWLGFLVLVTTTSLGIACSLLGIKKIFLMGSLILPVIIWYLI